ncbi:MAG: permease [Armatimonadota bacterium]
MRLARGTHLADAVNFFIYDTAKIFLLLVAVIYGVTLIRQSFSPQRVRRVLGGRREGIGNVMAAGLGVVTPFCSCSACPLFIGFVESGIPLGVTFSFLVSSPLVNEVALVMLFGMFGLKVAGLYVSAGLITAVVAGLVIGRLRLEDQVERFGIAPQDIEEERLSFRQRSREAWDHTRGLIRRVGPWVVAGIAVGAVIHGYVPVELVARWAGKQNPWAVPVAVLIALPLYSNAAGMIPIAQALYAKGMAMGTVLAFFMAVVGLSVPEFIILKQVIRPKLLAIFAGILTVSFVLFGYLFNALL